MFSVSPVSFGWSTFRRLVLIGIAVCLAPPLAAQSASDSEFDLESWVREAIAQNPGIARPRNTADVPWYQLKLPEDVSEERWAEALVTGLGEFETTQQRLACLKILVEKLPLTSVDYLVPIAEDATLDLDIRVAAVHVAAVLRIPAMLPQLQGLLDSDEPRIRAAAIDAIGIQREAAYGLFDKGDGFFKQRGPIRIATDPAIELRSLHYLSQLRGQFDDVTNAEVREAKDIAAETEIQLPSRLLDQIRPRIVDAMLTSAYAVERSAAARALVNWPLENYELRVAEWGVWIDSEGQLKLVQSVLDEIPDFVHRTSNRVAELKSRVNQIMIVTKPVIHVTVNQPMAVDIKAFIRKGQPWFAYPRPNDFVLQVGGRHREAGVSDLLLDEANRLASDGGIRLAPLNGLRDGYPWIDPANSMTGSSSGGMMSSNEIQAIGLNWQSMIVSPNQTEWMDPPDVPQEYQWWEELRQVKSAWIGSGDAAGNEAERFLYYDGPTLMKSPLSVTLEKNQATVLYRSHVEESGSVSGLLVFVDPVGKVRGKTISDFLTRSVDLSDDARSAWPLMGDEVIGSFLQLVSMANGLNEEEAAGFVSSWRRQFFETPGTRLIVRLTKNDYDHMCPLQIRPPPTELARVGLLVREFDAAHDP